MKNYNPNIHHRRSMRLKGYDYARAGLYFITLNCKERAHFFGDVVDGKMILNPFGEIAHNEWMATEKIRDNVAIHEFIIMPDHIHGIIEIVFKKNDSVTVIGKFQSPSHTIGSIIRGYKIAVIKKIKNFILDSSSRGELRFSPTDLDLQFSPTAIEIIQLDFKIWQRDYYDHIIRNDPSYHRISKYIIDNPAKWTEKKSNKN